MFLEIYAQGSDIFLKKKKRSKQAQGDFSDLIVISNLPTLYLGPCRKPDSLQMASVVFRDRGWVVLFCSLVYFLVYRNGSIGHKERPLGSPNPQ